LALAGLASFIGTRARWTLKVSFAGIAFVGWNGSCCSMAVDLGSDEDPKGEAVRRPL
jgi:hypothetical protein